MKTILNFLILFLLPFIIFGIIILIVIFCVCFILFDFTELNYIWPNLSPFDHMWVRILYVAWFFVSLGIQANVQIDFIDAFRFHRNKNDKAN